MICGDALEKFPDYEKQRGYRFPQDKINDDDDDDV